MNLKHTILLSKPLLIKKANRRFSFFAGKRLTAIFCFALLLSMMIQVNAQVIPYPDALQKATIIQSSISHPDTNGMMIGNGDINALIFSGNKEIILHLAKNDVWDARLVTENDPPLLKVDVEKHTWTGGGRPASWNNPFPTQTPPALIRISKSGDVKEARLDIGSAKATILSDSGMMTLRALAQHNVYLIETENSVTIEGFPQNFLPSAETTTSGGLIIVRQHLPEDPDYPGMDVFSVLGKKGKIHVVAVVTSRESHDPLNDAQQLVRTTLNHKLPEVIQEHEKLWSQFWSRSGVRLEDDDLQNWWYRELYYLRCLSKQGAYAIALQGGYNRKANWHGTWTQNYNAEQTFWAAFNTNHVELSEPYIDLINEFHPRARWYAKTIFNCEGAATPHNLWPFEKDPEQCVSVNKRQLAFMPWSYGIGTTGHGAHNLWLHYLYNPDLNYLKDKIYPVIRDYALFYASFAEKCRQIEGRVVFGPSVDPEHTEFGWDNSPYDISWAQHTLKAAIQAARDLQVDADLVKRWSDALQKLPYYPVIGEVVRVGEQERNYNIITPVVPMFPAEQVSWFSSDSEKALFKRTLEWINTRYNHNNSVVMLNVARARMSMTDSAFYDTKSWFKGKEQPNGLFYWKAHGFYMTEQTAVAGLITEFLMQSVDQTIRIFPSWPAGKDAEFTNLRACGGFLVSARLKNGVISNLKVESTAGGELKLVSPWPTIKVNNADGKIAALTPDSRGVIKLLTVKKQKLEFARYL